MLKLLRLALLIVAGVCFAAVLFFDPGHAPQVLAVGGLAVVAAVVVSES